MWSEVKRLFKAAFAATEKKDCSCVGNKPGDQGPQEAVEEEAIETISTGTEESRSRNGLSRG